MHEEECREDHVREVVDDVVELRAVEFGQDLLHADGARQRAIDRIDGEGVGHPAERRGRSVALDRQDREHAGGGAARREQVDAPGGAAPERSRGNPAHSPSPGR